MKFEKLHKLHDTLPEEEKVLWEINHYAYLFAKAEQYLRVGPAVYSRHDFFGMPQDTSAETLSTLESGCNQIVDEGRGLTPAKAFTGLGISGFYDLMRLFHFKLKVQRAILNHHRKGKGILDQIEFVHLVDGYTITLYNFVSYE